MSKIRFFMAMLRGWLLFMLESFKDKRVQQDVERWKKIYKMENIGNKIALVQLMANYQEFRNLYIYRKRNNRLFCMFLRLIYKPMDTLYIYAKDIGGGLFIQHGFATMIAAEYIGENCWINQQVTIGYSKDENAPYIEDNVMITCGAKVLGAIHIGSNAVIGANAVVIRDVESGAVMGGIPAKRIK